MRQRMKRFLLYCFRHPLHKSAGVKNIGRNKQHCNNTHPSNKLYFDIFRFVSHFNTPFGFIVLFYCFNPYIYNIAQDVCVVKLKIKNNTINLSHIYIRFTFYKSLLFPPLPNISPARDRKPAGILRSLF